MTEIRNTLSDGTTIAPKYPFVTVTRTRENVDNPETLVNTVMLAMAAATRVPHGDIRSFKVYCDKMARRISNTEDRRKRDTYNTTLIDYIRTYVRVCTAKGAKQGGNKL